VDSDAGPAPVAPKPGDPDAGPSASAAASVSSTGFGARPADPFSCRPPWEEHLWDEGEVLDAEGIPIEPPDAPVPLHVLTGYDVPPEEDPWADKRNEPLPASEPALPATSGEVKDLLPRLGSRDPSRMHYKEATQELVAVRRITAWLEARTVRLLTALVREALNEQPHGWPEPLGPGTPNESLAIAAAISEAAAALQIPEQTAAIKMTYARTLTGECPNTLNALEAGNLTPVQAAIITDETTSLPPEARGGFEHELLDMANECSTSALRRRSRKLRETRHPESISVRRAKKARDRHVELKPDHDGMAWLSAYLPAETAVAAFNHIQALALSVQGPGEPRTLTQLRTDALTHLLLTPTGPKTEPAGTASPDAAAGTTATEAADTSASTEAAGKAPGTAAAGPAATEATDEPAGNERPAHRDEETEGADPREHPARDGGLPEGTGTGIVPTVALTIPALTLLGLGKEPAHLDGYGPIPLEAAARLAANAPSFTRLLTDPVTGAVLAMDRKQYRPTTAQRRYLKLLYEKCVFYGCSRSSDHCELDHTAGWAEGGSTNVANLAPECKKHHRLKTETDWDLEQPKQGTFGWTSPAGLQYPTRPEPLVHTPPDELATILERHEIHDINTKLTAYYQRKRQEAEQAEANVENPSGSKAPWLSRSDAPTGPGPRSGDNDADETPPPF